MTFLVAFDGSPRSRAALERADRLGSGVGESVLAATVIPTDAAYAREVGWLDPGEPFDAERVATALRERVAEIAPDASFRYETTGRPPSANAIAKPIRKLAKRTGASMVFVGSGDGGRLTTTLSSISGRIGTDDAYDVVFVRSLPES
ncbi:universal stress protein [Haloarcula pelagica]|nr:universal stress protein [Halomicroarcula sp. YJ-61-S]